MRRLGAAVALLGLVGAGCAPSADSLARSLAAQQGGDLGAFCITVISVYGTVRVARAPGPATVTCSADGMVVTSPAKGAKP